MKMKAILFTSLALSGCYLSHTVADDGEPRCGDGLVQAGEVCDDGGEEGGTCSDDCRLPLPPPCGGEWTVLDSPDRHRSSATVGELRCDRVTRTPPSPTGLFTDPTPADYRGIAWYRFEGAAGSGMTLEPPPAGHCGGDATGWLAQPPPSIGDGVIDRDVCFRLFEDECFYARRIRVAHCDEFILYELAEAPQCQLRYCGDDIDVAAFR